MLYLWAVETDKLIHELPQKSLGRISPQRFTYPFCYTPDELCREASEEVRCVISQNKSWAEEIARGKMLGVLIVERSEGLKRERGFLAAFSGTLCGRSTLPYFVPPVFDLHDPKGHFQIEEAEISEINREISRFENAEDFTTLKQELEQIRQKSEAEIREAKERMQEAKRQRDELRASQNHDIEPNTEDSLIRESQFLKAEVHRKKLYWSGIIAQSQQHITEQESLIDQLKEERKQRSALLQQWLFEHFQFANARGETNSLLDIFGTQTPPAGAGECCAPKLLHYAYTHHLKPICMAEFWMGESPKQEIRVDGQFYPACQAKCKPILGWMLQGLEVEPNPMTASYAEIVAKMQILYEDKHLAVIQKPAGMLSVPGKDDLPSVWSEIQKRFPEAEGPIIVHRLDMDTSGLMAVALDEPTYHHLQQQFAQHTICKRYSALLEHALLIGKEGVIDLPLCPNPEDRPRQMVSREYGKRAITRYQVRGEKEGHAIISLWPETGRTHQLRMHMAHPEGLNNPIVGDRLYGTATKRLELYADELEFEHPETHERMHFELHEI